jgi:hypothetical protein
MLFITHSKVLFSFPSWFCIHHFRSTTYCICSPRTYTYPYFHPAASGLLRQGISAVYLTYSMHLTSSCRLRVSGIYYSLTQSTV